MTTVTLTLEAEKVLTLIRAVRLLGESVLQALDDAESWSAFLEAHPELREGGDDA
jgi:hypothetical protein